MMEVYGEQHVKPHSDMDIKKASQQERDIVENLMQAYLHDMSEFDGSVTDSRGRFDCGKYFSLYWSEPGRYPYLFIDNEAVLGFALVRQLGADSFSIAEFFILRHYRGKGLGRLIAKELFAKHSGTWHVAQLEANVPAQKFWRSIIGEYTHGNFNEGWSDSSPKAPMQSFCNAV